MNTENWVAPLFAALILIASFSRLASVAVVVGVVMILAMELALGGRR